MRDTLQEISDFIEIMYVRPCGQADVFEAGSLPLPDFRVFGGQLIAQSVMAAGATVGDDRHVHSLHAYFLYPGNPRKPLRFRVERLRDGGSFTIRQVLCTQDDRPVVLMNASFHRAGRGVTHQVPMPTNVPGPDDLTGQFPFVSEYRPDLRSPVELRRVPDDTELPGPEDENVPVSASPQLDGHTGAEVLPPGDGRMDAAVWMRFVGQLPDDPLLHAASLAYLSDYSILRGAFRMHRVRRGSGVRSASLDHSMWFHSTATVDGWTLYDIVSPGAGGMRVLGTGRLFTQSGLLLASVVQEGLLRLPPELNAIG